MSKCEKCGHDAALAKNPALVAEGSLPADSAHGPSHAAGAGPDAEYAGRFHAHLGCRNERACEAEGKCLGPCDGEDAPLTEPRLGALAEGLIEDCDRLRQKIHVMGEAIKRIVPLIRSDSAFSGATRQLLAALSYVPPEASERTVGMPERDYSNYNAPFCHHPEKCGPVGRCLREIACND